LQENKDNDIVITEQSSALTNSDDLTPEHFDYLETILHKMYRYQFRHVTEVSWRKFIICIGFFCSIQLFETSYILNYKLSITFTTLLLQSFLSIILITAVSVVSKCLTGLYHFKSIGTRVLQCLTLYNFLAILSPFLLFFNRLHPNLEIIFQFIRILSFFLFIYYVLYSFIPYKWLRRSSQVYVGLSITLLVTLSAVSGFRHYVAKDNELAIFSNIEMTKVRELASIDLVVDDVVQDLE
jgi:hypothetical protein